VAAWIGIYSDFSVVIQHPLYGPQAPGSASIAGAGETRKGRESLLQNTKGWARSFTSSPALFSFLLTVSGSSLPNPPWTSVIYLMARPVSVGFTEGEIIALVMKIYSA